MSLGAAGGPPGGLGSRGRRGAGGRDRHGRAEGPGASRPRLTASLTSANHLLIIRNYSRGIIGNNW